MNWFIEYYLIWIWIVVWNIVIFCFDFINAQGLSMLTTKAAHLREEKKGVMIFLESFLIATCSFCCTGIWYKKTIYLDRIWEDPFILRGFRISSNFYECDDTTKETKQSNYESDSL